MKTSLRIVLVLVAILLAGFAGFYIHLRGPSHKGKSLDQWVEMAVRSQTREEAKTALREMGPAAQKRLLAMLQGKESAFENKAAALLGMPRDDIHSRRMTAARGLQALGPDAAPAVPQLIEMLQNEETSLYAAEALAGLGATAISQLTPVLESGTTQARLGAAIVLARTGPAAEGALPKLTEKLKNDSESDVRAACAMALGTIGKDPAKSVEALTAALDDKAEAVQARAAEALGKFGEAAKTAVPKLQKLAASNGRQSAPSASEALFAIDPKAIPPPRKQPQRNAPPAEPAAP